MAADAANIGTIASVDVCVCTFRRPSVVATLASIAAQTLSGGRSLRVIVADNDTLPTAREAVEAAFAEHGLNGVYLHAPAQNISVARNACLDAVTAPLAAFIDDDEAALPGWLDRLVLRQAETGADVVFGRVDAVYSAEAPAWMPAADMHSTRPAFHGGKIEGGYTCNVLFRTESVGGLRFDPALGRTGGEDTTFFSAMAKAGAVLDYCPDAVVEEPVPDSRSSLTWLVKRSFRSGQTHASILMQRGGSRLAVAGVAGAKLAACGAMTVASVWSPARWRKATVRGALHAGVVAAALGKSPLRLYE